MSDFRVIVRIKNARILRAMEAVGISTLRELADRVTLPTRRSRVDSVVSAIINFKEAPTLKNGEWREIAVMTAAALNATPEQLWPEYMRSLEARRHELSMDVSAEQIGAVIDGGVRLEDRREIQYLMDVLNEREREIIELRYGLNGNGAHTYEEIAGIFGRTKERVRQIEHKALRKLRHRAEVERQNVNVECQELKPVWSEKKQEVRQPKPTAHQPPHASGSRGSLFENKRLPLNRLLERLPAEIVGELRKIQNRQAVVQEIEAAMREWRRSHRLTINPVLVDAGWDFSIDEDGDRTESKFPLN